MENRKNYTATLLLSFFLGGLGIHRFYTGYVGFGIIQLLTAGGCGIWTLIDFIRICFNNYKDAQGNELEGYSKPLGLVFFFIWVAMFAISVLVYGSGLATLLQH